MLIDSKSYKLHVLETIRLNPFYCSLLFKQCLVSFIFLARNKKMENIGFEITPYGKKDFFFKTTITIIFHKFSHKTSSWVKSFS